MRALLVDADPRRVDMVRRLLEQAENPTRLDWVTDEEQALSSLRDCPYDISLIAYDLAGGLGLDAVRRIRSEGVLVPWIVITDSEDRRLDIEAFDAGASDTICTGHLTADELYQSIIRAVRKLQITAMKPRPAHRRSLASAIDAELHNPTALILANLDCLDTVQKAAPKSSQDYYDQLQEMLRAALSHVGIGAILQPAESALDVCAILDDVASLVAPDLAERGTLVRDYQHVPLVVGTEPQLVQVFLNVILNAILALPVPQTGDGAITIRTRSKLDGRFVVVTISDNGRGIAKEHQPHIFDEFYSADDYSQRCGVGLALTKAIVDRLGGAIRYTSVPRATEFVIELPTHRARACPN